MTETSGLKCEDKSENDYARENPDKLSSRKGKMATYSENDIVLARDQTRLYEGKVVKVHSYKDTYKYFIHYNGWAPKYDVWVEADQLQRPKKKSPSEGGSKSSLMGISIDDKNGTDKSGKVSVAERDANAKMKRKREIEQDLYDNSGDSKLLKVNIPLQTKKDAVSEWTLITRNEPLRLLPLPRPVTVDALLLDFLEKKREKADESQMETYEKMVVQLKAFFNQALPTKLLYRQERQQYDDLFGTSDERQKRIPSSIYGAEHLVRLFLKLPELIGQVLVGNTELQIMTTKLSEIAKYVNAAKLISPSNYVIAGKQQSHGEEEEEKEN